MIIEVPMQLQRGSDGFWIKFGPGAMVNLTAFAEARPDIIRRNILNWCEEQFRDHNPQPDPTDLPPGPLDYSGSEF